MSDKELSEHDLQELKSAYAGIGSIVVHWQLLENTIEIVLVCIFHRHGGNEHWEQLPGEVQTSRKIECLREASRFKQMLPYRDELNEIVDEIYRAKTKRDDLVHGSLRTPKFENAIYKFTKMKRNNKTNVYEPFHMSFDFNTFPKYLDDLLGAANRLQRLGDRLMAHPDP